MITRAFWLLGLVVALARPVGAQTEFPGADRPAPGLRDLHDAPPDRWQDASDPSDAELADVAVLDITAAEPQASDAEGLAELAAVELGKRGLKVRRVAAGNIASGGVAACLADATCAAALGKHLGTDRALSGNLSAVGSTAVLRLELYQLSSGQMLAQAGDTAPEAGQLAARVPGLVDALFPDLAGTTPAAPSAQAPTAATETSDRGSVGVGLLAGGGALGLVGLAGVGIFTATSINYWSKMPHIDEDLRVDSTENGFEEAREAGLLATYLGYPALAIGGLSLLGGAALGGTGIAVLLTANGDDE